MPAIAASAQPECVLACSCGSTSNGVILGMLLVLFLTVACSTMITNNVLYVKDMITTQCLSMTLTTIHAPKMQSFAECSSGLCSTTNCRSFQFWLGCGKQRGGFKSTVITLSRLCVRTCPKLLYLCPWSWSESGSTVLGGLLMLTPRVSMPRMNRSRWKPSVLAAISHIVEFLRRLQRCWMHDVIYTIFRNKSCGGNSGKGLFANFEAIDYPS